MHKPPFVFPKLSTLRPLNDFVPLASAAAFALLGTGLVSTPAAHASEKAASEWRVLFASQQNRQDDIYRMRADGSDLHRLTNHRSKDCHPAPSTDGRHIAFSSERVGWWKVWSMEADGSRPRQLTDGSAAEYYPSWSPDGSRIAFASGRGGSTQIWVMKPDGSDRIQLTPSSSESGNNNFPTWSPDGKRIAFASDRAGSWDIFTMAPDGTQVQRQTSAAGNELEPAWFPDSRRLVFQAERANGKFGLQAVEADFGPSDTGEAVGQWLTQGAVDDRRPTVSPDGRFIVFEGRDGKGSHIYRIDADGSDRRQLTHQGFNYGPSWLPKSASVVLPRSTP